MNKNSIIIQLNDDAAHSFICTYPLSLSVSVSVLWGWTENRTIHCDIPLLFACNLFACILSGSLITVLIVIYTMYLVILSVECTKILTRMTITLIEIKLYINLNFHFLCSFHTYRNENHIRQHNLFNSINIHVIKSSYIGYVLNN